MSEPMTETGKHLHGAICDFPEPHGCHHKEGIAKLEAQAKAQEHKRLRNRAVGHHTAMGHDVGGFKVCDHSTCFSFRWLLAEPEAT